MGKLTKKTIRVNKSGLRRKSNRSQLRNLFILLFLTISTVALIPHLQTVQNFLQRAAEPAGFDSIKVQGNKLVTNTGKTIRLFGVNRSGTEYSCVQNKGNKGIFDGPADQASIDAIKSWKINSVRVPLNSNCWLGINNAKPGGKEYQDAIKNYVNLLLQNGLVPIIDLHWDTDGPCSNECQRNLASKKNGAAFWTAVATAFKDTPAIFEAYNEPKDVKWECWRDGCQEFAGMQELVNAIRATGAKNVISLGGLDWAGDDSQWLENKPNDPANNLAASWHMYDFKPCKEAACWEDLAGKVAAQVPVLTTEMGEGDCSSQFVEKLMTWLDQKGQSYFAWTWNSTKQSDLGGGWPCSNHGMIEDWDGKTPTGYGKGIKDHFGKISEGPFGKLKGGSVDPDFRCLAPKEACPPPAPSVPPPGENPPPCTPQQPGQPQPRQPVQPPPPPPPAPPPGTPVPPPDPIRINTGGAAVKDTDGNQWAADSGFDRGLQGAGGTIVVGQQSTEIYKSEHFTFDPTMTFKKQVPNGKYTVRLHFAEAGAQGDPAANAPGARVFNIDMEGQVLNNLDVVQEAGGVHKALVKSLDVEVKDGGMTIKFTRVKGNPMVSGIELLPIGAHTQSFATAGEPCPPAGGQPGQPQPGQPDNGDVSTEYVPPTEDNCGGKYTAQIAGTSLKKNFGDPKCDFSKEKLMTLVKKLDPPNADAWFNKIVPCESSYDPNHVNAGKYWGLFQMDPSTPPGQAPPAPGINGPSDRGDVNWQLQAKNAVDYLKNHDKGDIKKNWECARK